MATKTMPAKEASTTTAVWRCPICTYDNEDSMSACDICGVLRNPLVKTNIKTDNIAVGGMCKDSGASVMAKSLFASLPQRMAKASILEVRNDVPSTDNHVNFHKLGNMHGTFPESSSAFSYQNHKKVTIAPFKFDAPSPDDLVSSGLQSRKLKSKGSERDTSVPVELLLAAKEQESTSTSVTRRRSNGVGEKNDTPSRGNKPEMSVSNVNTEALSSKTGKAEITRERKTASISEFTPETWMIPDTVEGELSQLNLAIVGHVDSGKSTLSGRLLHLSGRISQKEMHKYEKEAKQQGKGSFAYAWALDESAEERERGITMTVGVAFFTSRKYHVVLLDSPGHRDFVPNMISGATQADAAILVVDASMGSFEAGIDATGGQTREHVQLIRSFGVDQIIVLVNKMDVVEYSKERFDFVKQKLGAFLRTCGFKESSISWVPASAMENQNLVAKSSDARLSWYKGPSLMDGIDSLQLPARDYSKPLLLPICDVKSQSQSQVSACGKLESGAIRSGFKVLVMPSKEIATARSLERDSQPCSIARAGDNVTVNLQGTEGNRVAAGSVICHPDYPVQVASQLELKILVLEISTPIVIGSQLEFHIHHAKEAAKIVKILSLLDPKTGKVTKKSPRCLLAKQNAMVEVALQGPVCVEEYSSCRALGRVFLRASGRTVALGLVTQIIQRES
ncbi:Translation elongation factor EF1A/initiation factor IF2gamma family protein [Perilla frutescens var. hirtella]|uniref:Translation elongation factor EF1A/initiation factor IF2gamma family protein n=1 Tax=Perilla frutescens var. hirtella TaxID=608512 RepID=A0AAD4J8Q3_PERFH|nr:Translation elongation factor EF1A/initiation factor IF2gamma family protein [Perilla frutescens var. hirtella]KAH6828906.1 Translation elongation factor EF1A/initiation factor IF2gamma family protein [Perilla frutescens var. hirtella]